MAIITNVRWSDAYNGSLSIEVDGRLASIPIDKMSVVDSGCLVVIFRKFADDVAGLLPCVKRDGVVAVQNAILNHKKLTGYWHDCYRALNDGTFVPGKLIDAGPIEV